MFPNKSPSLEILLFTLLAPMEVLLFKSLASTPILVIDSVRESAIGELPSPLLEGDEISHINGTSVQSFSPEELDSMLTWDHDAHNSLNFTICRRNDGFREISVPTRLCTDHSCSFKHFANCSGAVYVSLRQITECSFDEVAWILHKYFNSTQPASGLILDLRGNYGGCAITAFDIAALFLPCNTTVCVSSKNPVFRPVSDSHRISIHGADLVKEQYLPRYKTWFSRKLLLHKSTNMHPFTSIPLLLLVDSRCASGAEIIAWALRDNDRAQVWGDSRTFGKASAQV
jgi:C-terminal processing protease CtpA/Prc